MSASDVTTVKVTKAVRDRLARAARAQDLSANEFVDQLLTQWERGRRMATVAKAMRDSSDSNMASYRDEIGDWDQADLEQSLSRNAVST